MSNYVSQHKGPQPPRYFASAVTSWPHGSAGTSNSRLKGKKITHLKQRRSQMRTEVATSACQTWSCSVILFEFGGLRADAGVRVRGGELARRRLSLERPQECTAGRLSHSQLKLPRVTHRCKSPGPGAETHAVAATAQRPKWGPLVLPFGREKSHSNGQLKKATPRPSVVPRGDKQRAHKSTNHTAKMIYWPLRPTESPEGALKDALSLIFHTFCNMFTQLDCFIAAIEIRCD